MRYKIYEIEEIINDLVDPLIYLAEDDKWKDFIVDEMTLEDLVEEEDYIDWANDYFKERIKEYEEGVNN